MAEKKGKIGKTKMPLAVKFAFFIILMFLMVFLPATIVLVGGMMPTVVAALVDYRPQRAAWMTVGALNLAGIVPSLFTLWEMGHAKVENALAVLSKPQTLLVAYMAAGMGWLIYYHVPLLVAGVLARRADKRLKEIDKKQKELARKWGPEVHGGETQKHA